MSTSLPNTALPSDPPEDSFKPSYFFFYGTLQDPIRLTAILRLAHEPLLHPARVTGYVRKRWGPYPVLLPSPTDSSDETAVAAPTHIYGSAFVVEKSEDVVRLQAYETSHYKPGRCQIELDGGEVVSGWTFVWDADEGILREEGVGER